MPHLFLSLPVAAAENLIGIVFFVIAFIGWMANLVNQQQQPKKRPARRAGNNPQRGGQAQREIADFLKQSRQDAQERRANQADTMVSADEIEVIEPARRRAPQRPPQRQQPRPPQSSPPPTPRQRGPQPQQRRTKRAIWEEQTGRPQQSPPPPPPPAQPTSLAPLQSEPLSHPFAQTFAEVTGTPRESLANRHITSSVPSSVMADMPHNIDASVSSHMGVMGSTSQPGLQASPAASRMNVESIRALLTKENIRAAVLANTILARPRSLAGDESLNRRWGL